MTERRRDPLTGDWRTFASHRQDRTFLPAADRCPLCPGDGAEVDDTDFDVLVFDNKFPSFSAVPPAPSVIGSRLYPVAPAEGAAEVVVYSADHSATMADLGVERINHIVDVWADRYAVLGARPEIAYVFVFENRGEAVGVTLHHPHGQVYGYPEVPIAVQRALDEARRHIDAHGTCVGCDVVARERVEATRVVARNRSFLAHVPFAPRFPFELKRPNEPGESVAPDGSPVAPGTSVSSFVKSRPLTGSDWISAAVTVPPRTFDVVSTSGCSAVTVTCSETAPACRPTSTRLSAETLTSTAATLAVWNPSWETDSS